MSEVSRLPLGLSQPFDCSYRPEKKEQLLIVQSKMTPAHFEGLMRLGFRRSGSDVYRPHCPECRSCQPVRVDVARFRPSRSQKRVLARNRDLTWTEVAAPTEEQRRLYHDYIRLRHHDGPMYPPTDEQFNRFLPCPWLPQRYLEARLDGRLVLVAVTDELEHALSAVYTFFAPELARRSLGVLGILKQLELAQQQHKAFLYLGYQIDECRKMAYKTHYHPYQVLVTGGWQAID
ncbi:arginyltransferase [Ferrimonas sp. SCSIO 43195]|uniref:arginyltransferase n=1 Tax=Ferrimonas sp. SCSIO 43195 TaxID=2822844 RepID=UPI0020755B02|nr:arginyltransferase [Ferrimonas sp. SCSIO 43195]USD38971.1 arginyltransferase [Ferrimonas sp. SCSIO 43195]